MNILGVDYGRVNLGVAIAKEGLCFPLTVIKSKSDQHKLDELVKIIQKEDISKIVFGSGGDKLKNHIKSFAQKLAKQVKKEVVLIDETLTNYEAVAGMIKEGIPKQKRKEKEHAYAACAIIKIYLTSQTNG